MLHNLRCLVRERKESYKGEGFSSVLDVVRARSERGAALFTTVAR
jgi:hypothetical protein